MLTLRKNVKGVEIATKEIAPYLTRDLLYAFLIALALHLLPITLFTIKTLYFSYSEPIIHSITLAPSLQQLEISTDAAHFPAPLLANHEPIRFPPLNPLPIAKLQASPLSPYSLSPSLASRLISPSLPPETPFIKIRIKVEDRSGKIFFYDSPHALSKELHQWLMTLNFEKKPGSFATSGFLEVDTGGKHD